MLKSLEMLYFNGIFYNNTNLVNYIYLFSYSTVYGHKESSSSPSKSTRRGRHHTPCHNNSESNGPVNGPAWKDLFMRQHQIEMNWRHNSTQNYKVNLHHTASYEPCMCQILKTFFIHL